MNASTRPSWDTYFLSICREVASRATCPRKAVGCVLVRDRTIISTGYNGAVSGLPHCLDIGCDVVNNHCERVVHAEANAVAQAARNGSCTAGATAYVSLNPCWPCFKLLVNAGVRRFVYADLYHLDPRVVAAATAQGFELLHLPHSHKEGS